MKKLLGLVMILGSLGFSKVIEKKIDIENGYYKIPAIYTYDDEKQNQPLVVMLHSTGSNKDEIGGVYKEVAKKLIDNNIQSIRFDFIGCGESKVDYLQYTLTSAVSDTDKVIDYAKKQTTGKIGLLGWDQGATIALLEASKNSNISTVVTWSGTTKLFNEEVKKQYEVAKSNGFVQNVINNKPLKISLEWFEEAKNVNVGDEIAKIKAPVLAIAGKDDKIVNPIESVIIGSKNGNAESKIIYIPEANHVFNVKADNIETPQLISLISNTINWFVDKLK